MAANDIATPATEPVSLHQLVSVHQYKLVKNTNSDEE